MLLKQLASACLVSASLVFGALAAEPGDTLILSLKDGDVTIALRPDIAPKHVERIKTLVRQGAYDNVAFHRVIDGFMAQTGDVEFGDMADGFNARRAGTGGSSLPDLPAEFSRTPFLRGVVGMARAQDPNSANSEFFFLFAPAPYVDVGYSVVGEVESGMDAVDEIKRGARNANGVVQDPDRIIDARIASDPQ